MVSPVLVASLAPFHHYPTESTANGGNYVVQRTSTSSPRLTTTNSVDYCRGQADNYAAAEPGSKCRRYFRCNGTTRIYLCPGKLVFNGHKCVHPSEYSCHNNTIEQAILPVPAPLPSPVETKLEVRNF